MADGALQSGLHGTVPPLRWNKTPGVVTLEEISASRARRLATTPNLLALEGFVSTVLEAAAHMAPEKAAEYLDRQARFINSKIARLSAYAALPDDDDTECPADLKGLDFFDLSNARDRLSSGGGRT